MRRETLYFCIENSVYLLHTLEDFDSLNDVKEILNISETTKTTKVGGFYVGPRPEIMSSWCSNVLAIFNESGVKGVLRIERYEFNEELPKTFDSLTQTYFTTLEEFMKFDFDPPPQLRDGVIRLEDLEEYVQEYSLNFDESDLEFYRNLFKHKLKRNPTVAELHDLANSNSEHSRHHLFRAHLYLDSFQLGMMETTDSMMDLIKSTLNSSNNENSLVAFSDNASAIKGAQDWVKRLVPDLTGEYTIREENLNISFTAETHNFPTGIAPFQGANTGTGGRIRDTQAIGRGGAFVGGTCGYCVGRIDVSEDSVSDKGAKVNRIPPIRMLIEASNGASDYGNKIGEPVIQGFCRAYGDYHAVEWTKPIMFSGGIGHIQSQHLKKATPEPGWVVVRVGGPTYRIGIGGGAASSVNQSENDKLLCAVQRGDPQCENRMDRWLRACINRGARNPILSIHDQGAGGMANVTKEILEERVSAIIKLYRVTLGDPTLSSAETWVSESQEQITVLLHPKDLDLAREIAFRERIHLDCLGETYLEEGEEQYIRVYDGQTSSPVVNLPLSGINPPLKTFPADLSILHFQSRHPKNTTMKCNWNTAIGKVHEMLRLVDVGSKRFLTTKVDRSVGGLIAQQQCVGPYQTPVSDVAVIADSFWDITGAATAIGERTIINTCSHDVYPEYCADIEKRMRWSIYEMVTNIMFAPTNGIQNIKCSGNWMWPASSNDEKVKMFQAVRVASKYFKELNIAVDGGKDSVSMSAKLRSGEVINSPSSFVVSGYVECTDIRLVVTPGLKEVNSVLCKISVDDSLTLVETYKIIQRLLRTRQILSGHDVSDGGIITTLCEMAFASDKPIGIQANLVTPEIWFDDTPAIIIEIKQHNVEEIFRLFREVQVKIEPIAETNDTFELSVLDSLKVSFNALRSSWETAATEFEKLQATPECALAEHKYLTSRKRDESFTQWILPDVAQARLHKWNDRVRVPTEEEIAVAIIRGEGTNGDREMAAVLHTVGFKVYDYTTTDLCDGRVTSLDHVRGIIFPGGFTFSDALGSAAGWFHAITRNPKCSKLILDFRARSDTFVLGVCNGCQLLARLGWLGIDKMEHNLSNRFESRFVTVQIQAHPAAQKVWFEDLVDARLGVWVAHAEGRFTSSENSAFKYVSPLEGEECGYPLNPNGSVDGTAAMLSDDGRVLGMMPHPERCFKGWQLPYDPVGMLSFTPWILLFENAYKWCCQS